MPSPDTGSLRTALRAGTAAAHSAIETQYPFSRLGDPDNIENTGRLSLVCFKLLFLPFLEEAGPRHPFYEQSRSILSRVDSQGYGEVVPLPPDGETTHLEYVLLGSRMGNGQLVRQNPSLTAIPGGDYFAQDFPRELWTSFIQRTSEVHDAGMIQTVVSRANQTFQQMIDWGRRFEPV